MMLSSMVYNKRQLSIMSSVNLFSQVILIISVYTALFACFSSPKCKYEPRFSFSAVMTQVYGMGFLLFVLSYSLSVVHLVPTYMIYPALNMLCLDDVNIYSRERIWEAVLLVVFLMAASVIGLAPIIQAWEVTAVLDVDLFSLLLGGILPLLTPFLFLHLRSLKHKKHSSDILYINAQYALPFACVLCITILGSLHTCLGHSLNPDIDSEQNMQMAEPQFLVLLPMTTMAALFFLGYCILSFQTIEAFAAFTLAAAAKQMIWDARGPTAVVVFISGACALLCYTLLLYKQYKISLSHSQLSSFDDSVPPSDDI